MNWALFKKEWSGLRLSIWLIVAFNFVQLVYVLFSKFPDRYTDSVDMEDAIFSCVFFGILVGVTTFGQERDHGTLSFLDGLPVSRWRIFGYKVFAASLVLTLAPLLAMLLETTFQWLSINSTTSTIAWGSFVKGVMLQAIVGLAVAGAAACLSFTRKWFPLFAGIALLAFLWFRTTNASASAALNTPALFEWFTSKEATPIPTEQLMGHSLFATCAWLSAGLAFQVRDGWASRTMDRMATWRFASWLTGFSQLAAAIVWMTAMTWMAPSDRSRESVESQAAGVANSQDVPSEDFASGDSSNKPAYDSFGQLKTTRYELIFRESQRSSANSVYWSLDPIHEEVKQFFENADGPSSRIVLDTGSAVSSHVAGQTNWTKIRVPFHLASLNEDFLQTVRHETAHVFIEHLSGGRAKVHFEALRLFHEGVATSCQFSTTGEWSSHQRLLMERWAAGNDSRGRLQLPKLCSNSELEKERHTFVVYPLGYVLAEALQDIGGKKLTRRMLEVLRETPLPPGVRPEELWRILLQKSGSSSDMLMAVYSEKLDELAKRESSFLADLPRLRGSVRIEGSEIVIVPEWDEATENTEPPKPSEPGDHSQSLQSEDKKSTKRIVCEVERDHVLVRMPETIPPSNDGSFRLRRDSIQGSRIRYLLGWSTTESAGPIWEPWTEFTLP